MKKITSLFVLLLLVQLSYSQDTHKRIKIANPPPYLQQLISDKGIDLSCGVNHEHDDLILELSEFDIKLLKDNNINYSILIDDLTKFYSERIENTFNEAIRDL